MERVGRSPSYHRQDANQGLRLADEIQMKRGSYKARKVDGSPLRRKDSPKRKVKNPAERREEDNRRSAAVLAEEQKRQEGVAARSAKLRALREARDTKQEPENFELHGGRNRRRLYLRSRRDQRSLGRSRHLVPRYESCQRQIPFDRRSGCGSGTIRSVGRVAALAHSSLQGRSATNATGRIQPRDPHDR